MEEMLPGTGRRSSCERRGKSRGIGVSRTIESRPNRNHPRSLEPVLTKGLHIICNRALSLAIGARSRPNQANPKPYPPPPPPLPAGLPTSGLGHPSIAAALTLPSSLGRRRCRSGGTKCRARSSRSRWGNAGTRSGWSSGSSSASSTASARTAS